MCLPIFLGSRNTYLPASAGFCFLLSRRRCGGYERLAWLSTPSSISIIIFCLDRQWPIVPWRGPSPVGPSHPVHPTRQAQPERLHRAPQSHPTRRSARSTPVCQHRRCPRGSVLVDARIQPRPSTRFARRYDAHRICSSRQELYF